MRICIVAVGRYGNDPRARSLARNLARAGNDVVVVASGHELDCSADGLPVQFVPTRYPVGRGRLGRVLRRMQTKGMRKRLHHKRLAAAARATGADIFYPTSGAAIPAAAAAAAGTNATVVRDPRWGNAGPCDLIGLAPHHPELSVSPAGAGGVYLTPADRRPPYEPVPGRHQGRRIAICYRKTDTNPGKYLEAAIRRAGITVDLHTEEVDWTRIPADTMGVLFVEGPYPALRIKGHNPGFPVALWVHHGEHHVSTNLRLVEYYGAHTVLLAHSWHLAHRFPVPVHRFTFGVAPELLDASVPWSKRKYAVAMVGGQLRRRGGTYARRQRLVDELERAFGKQETAFASDVSAREMAAIYAQAKTVINEGGTRHYPITMRVLEAIGSGAILVTDDLPGTDMVIPRTDYEVLEEDVVAQIKRILANPDRAAEMAERSRAHAMGRHTYDHRVDDLVEILAGIEAGEPVPPLPELGPLSALVGGDVEVQRIAQFGVPELATDLPTREIWDGEEWLDRLNPNTMEAVVIGPAGTKHLERAIEAARRYLYAAGDQSAIEKYVKREHPDADIYHHDDLLRVDFNAESYRVLPHERSITS